MSRCENCGKGPQYGNNVSHSMRHTRRRWNANLQRILIVENGRDKHVVLCAKCLKTRQKAA